ncbi:MAG: hypothetical protein LBR64_09865 [Dysgonamonadaceae bacterium]|jgi:hypothetical protein|nr:hypothetical protein [Dysgonamonadaceae bacterium]
MRYGNIPEEELKNRVSQDFFRKFDCASILRKIDFAVYDNADGCNSPLLWAEAKQRPTDILLMLAQLVLTIGKARTFDEIMPPPFLGCFDCEKIAFLPYSEIQDVFYQTDFNWNVAPSNRETREFQQVYGTIKNIIENEAPFETCLFYFEEDEKELRRFIRDNFVAGNTETAKIRIDKNNFINVFQRWADTVMPTIQFNWEAAKKFNIISGDFYLADLISDQDSAILKKLDVVLRATRYEMNRYENQFGAFTSSVVEFKDNQKAYNLFWAKYERPPKEEYWNYIIERRELLVPQDIRERKGSFFTPRIWVEKAQEYLTKTFGEDWQDEYWIWDCCAGTGNLLAGLVNKDRIFASTLDKQDVDVMRQRVERGANLWEQQIFQFDFLNDEFLPQSKGGKLPDELFDIISDEKKRKRLLIYINPPYAEATTSRTTTGTGENKALVAAHKTKDKYKDMIGAATNEVSAQFMARIYHEISGCKLATFSTFKFVCTQNFIKFRKFFKADFKKGFAIRSNTFDNVKGHFPIGFTIWDLAGKKFPAHIEVEVPEENTTKRYYDGFHKSINQWLNQYNNKRDDLALGYMGNYAPDFQNINQPYITVKKGTRHVTYYPFTVNNFIEGCIYFAVRQCIKSTWLNNRDQFYAPNSKWENDIEFQNDCLAFTLFHPQNRISARDGVNHWIPFVESEVNANYKFESHVITNFIRGERKRNGYTSLFEQAEEKNCIKREFSAEAQAVFDAGREIWKYYNAQQNFPSFENLESLKHKVNASYYDIRGYFKGFEADGQGKERMNNKSADEVFNSLEKNLSQAMEILAEKIEPKVYEYGFLLQ